MSEQELNDFVRENDLKNQAAIDDAFASKKINGDAKEYLELLYGNSSSHFLKMFHILGDCLGAPKGEVLPYDYENERVIDSNIKISEINHLSPYMAFHRLDTDPVRNQFFELNSDGSNVSLSVSSMVNVIVGAQKKIDRAIDKITGKYYNDYIRDVIIATKKCLEKNSIDFNDEKINDKIKTAFGAEYITNAAEVIMDLFAKDCKKLAVSLVRELDMVEKPFARLKDVWRVKCLFDLVPQVRNFISVVSSTWPYQILESRDDFASTRHPRNFRAAKIILNISDEKNKIVPMEIICQVRTLFNADNKTHDLYKNIRDKSNKNHNPEEEINTKISEILTNGVREYNLIVYNCLNDLFERAGWNILYSYDTGASLFEGFPRANKQYVPTKITEIIHDKVNNLVENGLINIEHSPRKLTVAEEIKIFEWMTTFILVSALPYKNPGWEIPTNTVAGKLFTYVMKEQQRYNS